MRRYQNRNRDMMGYAGEPAPSFKPPQMPSQLDAKDERLLELSAEVGNLAGQNDLLVEDNSRLEDENRKMRDQIKEGTEENKKQRETLDEARERMYEAEREVGRLKQYEPKVKKEKK